MLPKPLWLSRVVWFALATLAWAIHIFGFALMIAPLFG